MPSRSLDSLLQITLHLLLNDCSVLKEVVRSKVGGSITDHIDYDSCQDGLLLSTIAGINLKEVVCINLVLDPFFIFTAGWGVKGAAAATVLAQFVGVAVHAYKITTRGMLPARKKNKKSSIPAPKPVVSAPDGGNTEIKSGTVIRTILGANA